MNTSRVFPRAIVAAIALSSATACGRASSGLSDARSLEPSDAQVVPAVADAASTLRAEPPKAVTKLIVQRVDSSCVACPEEPRPSDKLIGYDLLFEVTSADGTTKSKPEHVFCPKTLPDGGPAKPRLGPAMECRVFATCVFATPDAGASERAEITCDAERVRVASEATKTILTGSFGEREIAPYSTRIVTERAVRKALRD